MSDTVSVQVMWHKPQWWNKYERGSIVGEAVHGTREVWRQIYTGQIRLYSKEDWDNRQISINGRTAMTMHQRGRYGKLYISDMPKPGDYDYVRP